MHLTKQLQQDFFQHFLTKGSSLLTPRHLNALIESSYHTVEEIFAARYDETYVANLANQKVFMRTLADLDDIIAACRRMRVANKSKRTILMQDETYLKYYLALLFTKEEKKTLQELVSKNFQTKKEEGENAASQADSEEERSAVEVLGYILKSMFGIGSKAKIKEEQENVEDEGKAEYWSCDFKGN